MPERLWSDQVNFSNSQKTKELLPQKHEKIMAFTPTTTFGQLFPFQMSFEAKLFSSPETVVAWLTRQQKTKIEMRTKATGLCAKSRRAVNGGVFRVKKVWKFWIVRMPELKMLENVLKPKETSTVHAIESTLREDWDEIGSNRLKTAMWCLKVPFFLCLPGVDGLRAY